MKNSGELYRIELARKYIDGYFEISVEITTTNYTHITKTGNLSIKDGSLRVNKKYLDKIIFYEQISCYGCRASDIKHLTDFRLTIYTLEDKNKAKETIINKYKEIIESLNIDGFYDRWDIYENYEKSPFWKETPCEVLDNRILN